MSRAHVLPRLVGAGGIAWGAVLLTRGDEVWGAVEGRAPDDMEQFATRVLGGRHVVQGGVQFVAPRASSGVVALVDVLHALSMAPLAVASPPRRRAAVLSGGVALASAAMTSMGRRRP